MRHRLCPLLTLLLVLSAAILVPGAVTSAFGKDCGDCAQGGTCSCGDTVVCDTKLDAKDPVLSTVCSGSGLFVANGVTLHVAGTLTGLTGGDTCGIDLDGGGVGVTITTGSIVGFTFGICSDENLFDSTFKRLTILNPGTSCIALQDQGDLIPSGNLISQVNCKGAGGDGIVAEGGPNTIEFVKSNDNGGSGFLLRGGSIGEPVGTTLRRSQGLRNKGDGLVNHGCGAAITSNKFNDNKGFGIQETANFGPECPPNVYEQNQCDRNMLGKENRPNLCR